MITISKYSNTIEYNLRTTLDRSGLTQLQIELNKVSVQLKEMQSQRLLDPSQVDSSISTINKFKSALNSSFNSKIGMLDMSKFVGQLQESKVSLNSLQNSFALAGNTGKAAFAGVLGQLGKIDTGIKSTSSMVDKIFNTMGNTVRWGIMSSAFNGVTDSIRQSVEYAKDLDDSLTQIMLVTDYSRDSMVQYAKQANEAAKALGSTTVAMTNASLVYSQQGFDLNKSQQLAEMSTKLANASQQDTSTTSDQITAYMNAYGLDDNIDKLNAALDSWANVANISAADVGELAEASQKAASAAATLGVSTDQLNAQIATIESVTREAPEQIGNGLKTLYARFSDLSMGKTLDDGVDLGKVTSTLDKIGVQVLDGDGKMRGVGNIMEDLMKVWDSIDSTQKAAVGQTLAGKFQLTRFEALMNRADLYKQYKAGSENANGTLDVMNEKYVDSLQGKLNKLQTTFEGIINSLGDSSDFYGFIDGLSTALDLMQKLVDSIGGGSAALTLLGATATKVFSTTMSRGIASMIQNHQVNKTRKVNAQTRQQKLQEMGYNHIEENESTKPIMDFVNTGIKYQPDMNEGQAKEYNSILDSLVTSVQKVTTEEDKMREAVEATNIAMRAALETSFDYLELTRDENGVLQIKPTDVYDIAIRNSQDKLGKLGTNELKQITGEQALKSGAYSANLTRNLSTIKAAKAEDATAGTKTRATAAMQTAFDRGKSLVKEFMGTDNIWDDRFNEYEEKIEDLRSPIQQLIVSLRELSKVINEDNYNFDAAIETLGKVQNAANGAAEAADVATKQQNATRKEDRIPLSNVGEAAQQNNKMQAAQEELKTAQGRGEGFNEGMDLQNDIQQIVQATSAIGQLGFAWQSFQNLGSIWANADLTDGEKLESTFLNLTMVLPNIISGITMLSDALKALDSSKAMSSLLDIFNGISSSITNMTSIQNTSHVFEYVNGELTYLDDGAQIASEGIEGLSAAFASGSSAGTGFGSVITSLLSSINPVTLALTVAAVAIGGLTFAMKKHAEEEQERIDAIRDNAEQARKDSESIKDLTSSFDDLYSQYQDGADNSDALSSAAKNINDVIDDQSLKVAAASGNWKEYANSLRKAQVAQLNQQNKDLWAERNEDASAANDSFNRIDFKEIKTKGTYKDITSGNAAATTGIGKMIKAYGKDFSDLYFNNSTGTVSVDKKLNDEEAYKELEAFLTTYNQHQEEFLSKLSANDKDRIEKFVASAKEQVNNESVQSVRTNDQTLGANYAEIYKDDKSFKYQEGQTIEQYTNTVKQALKEQGINASSTLLDAFVQGMMQGDSDSSKQLAAEQVKETSQNTFEDNIKNNWESSKLSFNTDQLAKNPQSMDMTEGLDFSKYSKEISSTIAQAAIDQVNESSLSDEDKQKLLSSIDWSNSISDILATITEAVDTGDVETALKNNTSKKHSNGELAAGYEDNTDLTKHLEDEYDVSNDVIDTYKQQMEATTDLGKTKQELADEVKKTTDEFGSESKEAKQAQRNLDNYNDSADDTAAKTIQTQKGLDKLSESFEDNYKILKSGDKTTLSYVQALTETKDALADVLNTSSENISNDFVESHLNKINQLANGDLSALDSLREAAAQDYVVKISQEGNLTTENLEWLQNQITQISGMSIDVGSSLNDQGFIDGLNDMLDAGTMTVDQVNSLFGMMGYDPTITWKTERKPVFDLSKYSIKLPDPLGEINLPNIKIMGDVSVPQINGGSNTKGKNAPTKVGGGSGSYSGHGLSAPSGGGGSKGGGGGGGGGSGSGSSYTAKEKKEIDNEVDLYERVNTILEKVNSQYEQLNKERDRLTGKKLAENIAKETALLERQIAVQKEKQKIQDKEAADLRNELSSSFGVQFDSEGYIANYADVYNQLVNKVNELGAKYPTLTSDEQEKALDKEYDAAEKALDKFNTKYKRYDELFSGDMEETKSTIEDLKDSIEDLRIEVLKTQVEALDNLKDIQESLVDFDRAFNRGIKLTPYQEAADNVAKLGKYFDVAIMSVNEYYDNLIKKQEDAANAAGTSDAYKKWSAGRVDELKAAKQRALNGDKSVDYYGTGYFDMSMKNLTDINAQMKQFEETGKSDIFGENSADLYDVAKTVYEQAAGLAQDYWSLIENLHDNVMDMIDDISDKMDRRKDQYEAITDELEHWLDITELLHGEESYDDLNTILGAQQNNYKAQLNELMQQRDIWKDMLGSMKEGSEEWNEVSDKIKDATSDINDLIQNSLENLQKQYSNTVSKITKAWGTKAVGTDLDWMNTQWELINRNADYYLDDVNKSYNIQKLQSKYLDLLDGSNDLAIQQKISAQMKEQLEYLRDKTKLSEYDVNYASAQLEILQKQIALEEAQRNKSQMKLRRDTQGNYSYVYTANDDNVRSAQSDLLDAQNNAYNMSKDQMKQTQSDSLSALQDAQSTVNDIWNNANLSLEEKTKRTQTIIDSLKEYLAGTSEQLSTSQKNIINDFIGMCDMLTGENKDNLQDVYDQIVNGSTDAFDQIDTRWSTSLTSWLQNMDQFKADTDKMLGDLTQAGKDYADGTKTIADLAKTNFDDISNSISGTTDKTKELADSTKEFVNILKDVSGEVKKTESTMTDYANRITDANNNMQAFKQLADETANKLSKKEQENANLSEALKQAEQKNYNYEHYGNANGPSSGGGGGGAGANEDTAWGIAKAIWTYGWASGWGNDPVRSSKLTGAYGTAFARHVQDIINQYSRSGKLVDYGSMKYSSKNLIGYDTGGYTGSWSDKTADAKNGKLAVLHQKELVLNATDTQNILATVESVRSFADSLKSTSLAQSLSTALGAVSGAKANNASETINQNVHITAEFPAANSAAEIEAALMSLNDRAVQYAYKFR